MDNTSTLPGEFSIRTAQKHADELYKLVIECNPDGNMFRNDTVQDRRVGAAVWHAHEVSKYLSAATVAIKRMVDLNNKLGLVESGSRADVHE